MAERLKVENLRRMISPADINALQVDETRPDGRGVETLAVASIKKAEQPRAGLRIREIQTTDIQPLAAMFSHGFATLSQMRFAEMLTQLSAYDQAEGFPQLGFLLDRAGEPVGALLTISSTSDGEGESAVKCNFACWYVKPAFRVYAGLLVNRLRPRLDTTYVNISPATGTLKTIQAQGFRPFNTGVLACMPALASSRVMARVDRLALHEHGCVGLSSREWKILKDHETYGCISLICRNNNGTFPFVFRRHNFRLLPVAGAQLIYCRHIDEFVALGQPLGKYLAQRGMPWVVIGCNGPLAGLPGKYIAGRWPMYYRGASPPGIGDLTYTERSLFGL